MRVSCVGGGLGWAVQVASGLTFFFLLGGVCGAQTGGVTVTGTTTTQVHVASTGSVVVTPAAAKSDVSYNAFSRFDVGAPGVQFNNADVKARTIVAEVFSALPSRIEGPVSVNGPRANLILANASGLRVNGGSFVNFGSVALTTGAVSLRDETLSSGSTQRYVDLATHQGDIQIEGKGLDANLVRLEMIARRVGIAGPITNAYSSGTALTRLVTGSTTATFDTLASPTDNLTPWVYYDVAKAPPETPAPAIAVDISAGSTLASGRIEILVTEKGAGVRNAGKLTATAGDLVLSANGTLEQRGGELQAAGNVRVKAVSLHQTSQDGRDSLMSASAALRVEVEQDILNQGGTLRGTAPSQGNSSNSHAVSLTAGGTITHETVPGATGAIVFGSAGDVSLKAPAGVNVINARIVSNGALDVVTSGVLRTESRKQPGSPKQRWSERSVLTSQSGSSVDHGQLIDPDHRAYLVAHDALTLKAAEVQNIGGHIFSNNGSLNVQATRSITNQGLVVGQLRYESSCFLFLCRRSASTSEALVGGQMQAGGTLTLTAGDTVLNDGGSIYALGDVTVSARQTIARGVPLRTVITRASGLKALFGDTWAGVYAADQGGSFTAAQGRLILNGAARQEGGTYVAAAGIDGTIDVLSRPHRDPVELDDHIGLLPW